MSARRISRAQLLSRGWHQEDIDLHLGPPINTTDIGSTCHSSEKWLYSDVEAAESNIEFGAKLAMRLEFLSPASRKMRKPRSANTSTKRRSVRGVEQGDAATSSVSPSQSRHFMEIEWVVSEISDIPGRYKHVRIVDTETARDTWIQIAKNSPIGLGDVYLILPNEDERQLTPVNFMRFDATARKDPTNRPISFNYLNDF